MAALGSATTIKLAGTPTTMTGEACGAVTGSTVYQVTAVTKRAIDPDTALTVLEGGVAVAAADISSIDYNTGTITFATDRSGAIAVTGKYLPLLSVADAYALTTSSERSSEDSGVFGDDGPRKLATQRNVSVEVSVRGALLDDYDSGAGTQTLMALLVSGAPFFLEVKPGGAGPALRGQFTADSGSVDAPQEGIVGAKFSASSTVRTATFNTTGVQQVGPTWSA